MLSGVKLLHESDADSIQGTGARADTFTNYGHGALRVKKNKKSRKWSNCTDHTEALTKTIDCTGKAKKGEARQKFFSGASRLTCASHF